MTNEDKILKRLCGNIAAGRFNWRKYCTPQLYFGWEICVTPLHCSYGQIGYTVHFPYTNIPEVEYDWEMGKLTIDGEKWKVICGTNNKYQYGTEFYTKWQNAILADAGGYVSKSIAVSRQHWYVRFPNMQRRSVHRWHPT